ncbi:G-rich sequence factor 1-like [Centropristis striata]|uniref:G-rich sequence factor 1-like n=1 Tax=Centropristis striata TaxID=184440 RepID=UPI0027E16E34|nr:G-rich sequence factor 1-like [Centropristis striata]
MSRHSRSVLFLLQRCVAVRQVTLPTGITTRYSSSSSLLSGSCGFIQQRTWTSTSRAVSQLQAAVRSSQVGFCTKTGEHDDSEYPPLSDYPSNPVPEMKEVHVVHVRGLPWTCTAQDLLQFFSDCRIRDGESGIHLTAKRNGRPTGQAFIEMEHEEDVSKALEKHLHYLGPRYVEVSEVTDSRAEALMKEVVQPSSEDGVVRLLGLPFSSTEDDIVQFFAGLDIMENGITIVLDGKGRNSGEAFVQFSSQQVADEAQLRDRQFMDTRYIKVIPSRRDQIYTSWKTRSSVMNPQLESSNRPVSAPPRTPPSWSAPSWSAPPGPPSSRPPPSWSAPPGPHSSWSAPPGPPSPGPHSSWSAPPGPPSPGPPPSWSAPPGPPSSWCAPPGPPSPGPPPSWSAPPGPLSSWSAPPGPPSPGPPPSWSAPPGPPSSGPPPPGPPPSEAPLSSALHHHHVHMRGLPFNTSPRDIVKFFSPLVLTKIVFDCRDGKLCGEAGVYFESHQDALSAMSKNRMLIEGRYIELFLNSPE